MIEMESYIRKIGDKKLRRLVRDLLKDPKIRLEGRGLQLGECPAGAYMHHTYKGGLIQHTVSVVRLALTLCDLVEEVYGGEVERDVVTAGALLHDIMKCYSYEATEEGGFTTSKLGERIDHLTLLVAEMYRRGFPLDVIHVAASHHGEQSPVKPKTLEALIVSIADYADSELSRKVLRAAEYLLRQAPRTEARRLTQKEALEVVKAKSRGGWEGVRRLRLEES